MSEFTIKELPDGWKPSEETLAYIQTVIEGRKVEKRPPSTVQCASTMKAISMSSEERQKLNEWRESPQYLEDIKSKDEKFWNGVKSNHGPSLDQWDIQNISHVDSTRRTSKNTLGQSELDGSGKERKEAARQAFSHTPAAPITAVQEERVTRIESIKELTGAKKVEKQTFWQKVLTWYRDTRGPETDGHGNSFAELYPENPFLKNIKEKPNDKS